MDVESDDILKKRIFQMFPLTIHESSLKICPDICDEDDISRYQYHSICKLLFSIDGEFVFVACFDGYLKILDRNLLLRKAIRISKLKINDIVCSYDGKCFAVSCYNEINIYNMRNFEFEFCLIKDLSAQSIVFSKCSSFLFTIERSGKLSKWDLHSRICLQHVMIGSFVDFYHSMDISCNCNVVAIPCHDEKICFVDVISFLVFDILSLPGNVKRIKFASYFNKEVIFIAVKKFIERGEYFNALIVYNIKLRRLLRTITFDCSILAIESLVNNYFVILTDDGYLRMLNLVNGMQIQKISVCCDISIVSIVFSLKHSILLCGRCKARNINQFSIKYQMNNFYQHVVELVTLSRKNQIVISVLLSMNIDSQYIRILIATGVWVSITEFSMIIDFCWDLVDYNEDNNGNMHLFLLDS
eukprot:TRINITY_DN1678_c0_g1_i1.p1 TRINITY_DN1678_c0_g1~~TRINITY_DN1678_c0_g1_i1.p1  ORF type:complete len:414 (+),score=78.46 TRINITY_DN1678_c0_g1_i1:172-1413(+)